MSIPMLVRVTMVADRFRLPPDAGVRVNGLSCHQHCTVNAGQEPPLFDGEDADLVLNAHAAARGISC